MYAKADGVAALTSETHSKACTTRTLWSCLALRAVVCSVGISNFRQNPAQVLPSDGMKPFLANMVCWASGEQFNPRDE